MSIIPDYVAQAQEVSRQLEAQAMVTAQSWSDTKRNEYYDKYVQYFIDWLDVYIHGSQTGKIIRGRGLNELLSLVQQKIDEFEDAGGSIAQDIVAPGCDSHSGPTQFMAPVDFTRDDVNRLGSVAETPPEEQSPASITENRANWTVDYNLNSPGNFSAENLRDILNKRRTY